MNRYGLAGGLLAVALGAVALLGAADGRAMPPAAAVELSTVVSFDPAQSQLPESITTDDAGNLYASVISGVVFRVESDGSLVTVGTLPLPAGGLATGIKVGPDGLIYVGSASFAPDPAAAFIWRVDPTSGAVELFATLDPLGFPNDLAFDDDGNLYVTDPFLGQVWQVDATGTPSVWLADPLLLGDPTAPAFAIHEFGVDGIAFDRTKRNLFVSNVDFGTVFRIPFSPEDPGALELFVQDDRLKGIDGIAFDVRGTLYAAINPLDRLATIDSRGVVSVIAEGPPLDGPSSFAFGGPGERRTLFVSSFAINRFLAGEPSNPAILSTPVPVPGLRLP